MRLWMIKGLSLRRRAPVAVVAATVLLSGFGGQHARAENPGSLALGVSWKGYADTDLRFSEFFNEPHTIVLRFMPQFPRAYEGPLVAENGNGTFLLGQGNLLEAPCDLAGGICNPKLSVAVGSRSRSYPTQLVAGRWYHLAVTVDGKSGMSRHVSLYLNGKRLGSPLAVSAGDPVPAGTLRFGKRTTGRRVNGRNAQFYGFIDDVGVFKRKLTTTEIASFSASTSELTGNEQRLLAGYTFNNGAMPAKLARPIVVNGAAQRISVSPNRDGSADAEALPLPSEKAAITLPFAPGEPWKVAFGNGDSSHVGYAQFAWDFILADQVDNDAPYPRGSDGAPLYAAAPGRVVTARESEPPVTTGREDPTNIVEIERAPDEFYGYLHLRQNSVEVAVGDQVAAGQKIALNGNTGMGQPDPAKAPQCMNKCYHLHFATSDKASGPDDQLLARGGVTIPIAFSNYEVRNADGTWRWVSKGIPEQGEVIRAASSLWGYVWADEPELASYTPNTDYQRNSTNALNTIVRTDIGAYSVTFANLGVRDGSVDFGGAVNVTAYDAGSETCKVTSWGPNVPDLTVHIRCFAASGSRADTRFTASFTHPKGSVARFGYVWADQPTAASYTPDTTYQYNSTGVPNTITRSATGVYQVRMPGLGGSGGTANVTAYGYGSETCKVSSWVPSGGDELVNVACHTAAGAPTDTLFTMTFSGEVGLLGVFTGPGPRRAFVWADQPTAGAYTPNSFYQFNSSGGTNTIVRLGVGAYRVTLPGLGAPRGHVQVTAYGESDNPARCKVDRWFRNGSHEQVVVRCFSTSGMPTNSEYVLQFVD